MKNTKPKRRDVAFPSLPAASAPRAAIYDHIAGLAKLPEPPWGKEAAVIGENVVICRHYKADGYVLAFRFGGVWHEFESHVRADDPAIELLKADGRLVDFGEHPAQRAKREAQERERRERFEAEQRHKDARRRHHEHLREQREARQRQAVAARNAGM